MYHTVKYDFRTHQFHTIQSCNKVANPPLLPSLVTRLTVQDRYGDGESSSMEKSGFHLSAIT
jgi:hypothetical protein